MNFTANGRRSWHNWLITVCLISLLVTLSEQQEYLQQTYCSNQNTGSSNLANSSIYQSLGNCQGICRGNFAYGIVLGKDCFCSNTAPSNRQDISACSDTCFGYPFERCGSAGNNLYGYVSASAAAGFTTSSASSSSPVTATTPITSQSLRTVSGSVITATVTIMPTGAASAETESPRQSKKISGGSIAGIVVGVIVGAIALIAAITFGLCFWRRRKNAKDDSEGGLNRNTSVLSRKILLGGSRGTNGAPYAANGADMQERRSSKPLGIDQRLNPNAFMQHDDGSRSSFVSMQDNRDYTRTLNVRNPDVNHPAK